MTDELHLSSSFRRQLDKITKKYPKDKESVNALLKDISNLPFSKGDRERGFREHHVRKVRVGFPQHKISKRDGARLCYFVQRDPQVVVFVSIYLKSEYKDEKKEQSYVRQKMIEIIKESKSN
ncbi:MAG: hypothetical protein OEZ04_07130 [Nitrospinota bacterium]|nr:hypothetical protein [Nitrospinota bacterium]